MTTTMKTFLIANSFTGAVPGIYAGGSENEAVEAYAVAAGYRNAQHEDVARVLDEAFTKLRDVLVITEVDVAATIKEIAEVMVASDRESVNCDDVRDDADAGDASHWDTDGVAITAQAAGIDIAVAEAVARDYMHLVHHAYGRAWRAAVEADLAARDEDAA